MASTGDSTPKRRKLGTDGSFTFAGGYNSENDSGDELFADHETVATLPLPRTQNTVATVPVARMVPVQGTFVTQPTQILESPVNPRQSTQASTIQVAASSPFRDSPLRSPAPISKSQINPRSLGLAMAPKGTVYRQPYGIQQAPFRAKPIRIEDDEIVVHSDDSDDHAMRSNIKPSVFTKGGKGLSVNGTLDESPADGTNKFKDLTSRFAFDFSSPQNPPSPAKPRADDMASAYGGSRRADRPRPVLQAAPARAAPVADLALNDIPDYLIRETIKRMQAVLPSQSVAACQDALRKKKSNFEDALAYLTEEAPIDLTVSEGETAPKGVANTVTRKQPPKLVAKRQVQAPARTIQDKWSSTQLPARPQQPSQLVSSPVSAPAPKPRRRLVKAGKNEPVAISSSPPQPLNSAHAPVLLSDGDSEHDSAVVFEQEADNELETKLLNFLNTCTAEQLVDLSTQSAEVVSLILAKRSERPFRNLEEVRQISGETTTETKTGKRRTTKKVVGEKLVDICLEMWTGFEAIDQLVQRCEELGRPIAEEMKTWGVDASGSAKDGEGLTLLSLGEVDKSRETSYARDSGIGTPSSSPATDDEKPTRRGEVARSSHAIPEKTVLLRQPAMMSQERPLKDYQLVGLNWLALLFRKKMSGILADDMGLGKTCQVIAFLSHLYEKSIKGPHLVVVQASTLENWLREFRMFSPSLLVEPYYGLEKERAEQRYAIEDNLEAINVVVTTYDLVAKPKDASFLRRLKPIVCVYDEGQKLKNSESKLYGQCMRIMAQCRLLLTGTPLQNNLQEMASLLGFIMPDVFQAHKEDLSRIFKYRAKTTDTDHGALLSSQRIARAKSMLTPFMLRRKKHQVLGKHLPPKIRRVEYCEMLPTQKEIYDEWLDYAREAVEARAAGTADWSVNANVLTDLRKAAIHPLLHRRIFDDAKIARLEKWRSSMDEKELSRAHSASKYYFAEKSDIELHLFCQTYPPLHKYTLRNAEWMNSGKVQKLASLLTSFRAAGARTLIFSQWVKTLHILELVLETLDMPYHILTGDTPVTTRQDMIDDFYADASIPVFLLSTGAGGTGINLACANKVVIFDGSFNPQEDVQAENRAHRVGQVREVEVVRLVSGETVEVDIWRLGVSKLRLDERVAGEGEGEEVGEGEGKGKKEGKGMGEEEVGRMVLEGIRTGKSGGDEPGAEEVEEVRLPLRPEEVKKRYLEGLKEAGLDMSAAR